MRYRGPTLALAGLLPLTVVLLAVPGVPVNTGAGVPGRMCLGQPVTIVGTSGDDVIRGTSGADVIATLAGRDRVIGRGGDDLVCVKGQSRSALGVDAVLTGHGDDRVVNRPRRGDRCAWGRFRGGPGDDAMAVPCGTVSGGTGADRLSGGGEVHPGPGRDTVVAAGRLSYSDARHRVRLNLLRDVAFADGVDTILGDPQEVYGSPFKDVLRGGPMADYIDGGPRGDIIYGRAGTDYVFESTSAHGTDIAFGGPDEAFCVSVEERHNCPVWDD